MNSRHSWAQSQGRPTWTTRCRQRKSDDETDTPRGAKRRLARGHASAAAARLQPARDFAARGHRTPARRARAAGRPAEHRRGGGIAARRPARAMESPHRRRLRRRWRNELRAGHRSPAWIRIQRGRLHRPRPPPLRLRPHPGHRRACRLPRAGPADHGGQRRFEHRWRRRGQGLRHARARHRSSSSRRAAAGRRRPGQPQPARLRLSLEKHGGGRRHLLCDGGPALPPAGNGLVRPGRSAGAGSAGIARSGGAGHRGGCGLARPQQPHPGQRGPAPHPRRPRQARHPGIVRRGRSFDQPPAGSGRSGPGQWRARAGERGRAPGRVEAGNGRRQTTGGLL